MHNNPYDTSLEPEHNEIWEILIRRDAEAFIANDWSLTEPDFDAESFYGIDALKSKNPDDWKVRYSTLSEYRDDWILQRTQFDIDNCADDPKKELLDAMEITSIEIRNNIAVAHKKFDGRITIIEGDDILLNWQTLYYLSKASGRWKIIGFTGYMPYQVSNLCKSVPTAAKQHVTAGPYSPVLEVTGNKLIVISGQAAINFEGNVVGETIEEQTQLTINNCMKQLSYAGATLNDVFKVNVYLTDLAEWERFNNVYKRMMPTPLPVRTAVQTGLLLTLKVEIEMWAMFNN